MFSFLTIYDEFSWLAIFVTLMLFLLVRFVVYWCVSNFVLKERKSFGKVSFLRAKNGLGTKTLPRYIEVRLDYFYITLIPNFLVKLAVCPLGTYAVRVDSRTAFVA
jgi:hypothetical protein